MACGAFLALGCGRDEGDPGQAAAIDGKALFATYCAGCHKDGGNSINPQKTLSRSDRAANGLKTKGDLMKLMRAPGPGMPKFDRKDLPDEQAEAIAEYVISNF